MIHHHILSDAPFRAHVTTKCKDELIEVKLVEITGKAEQYRNLYKDWFESVMCIFVDDPRPLHVSSGGLDSKYITLNQLQEANLKRMLGQ